MKSLKVLLVLTILFSSAYYVNAQRFGVKTGLNLTNLKPDGGNIKAGFHLGPTAEFPLGDIFSIESGVMISTKGTRYANGDKIKLTYLDIPINARAGYDFGSVRVYGILGPYFAVALGGKDDRFDKKIDWGGTDGFNRFDVGMTIGACTAVKIFEVGFTYNHGFVNLGDAHHDLKNRVFSIFVAYKFGKKVF